MQASLTQSTAEPILSMDEPSPPDAVEAAGGTDELVLSDLLVEEISIDGMCGVY